MPTGRLLAQDRVRFYQKHLDGVSRSFAACIHQLQAPLREWTSLAYLLCRTLDTVEDSRWATPALQSEQYAAFDAFVRQLPCSHDVSLWAQRFPADVPAGEQALLQDGQRLFAALHALPAEVLRPMQGAVLCMSTGMRHYTDQAHGAGGVLRLLDMCEVNRYCYFVAGLVGHLLTQLFAIASNLDVLSPPLLRDALHFGLFLQKVNLLKDQRRDEAEGRYLVPSRPAVYASLPAHARGALAYMQALPQHAKSYRTFCAWSLFLGAASLPTIETAYTGASAAKLPRVEAEALLTSVAQLVQDNAALQVVFDKYMALWPKPTEATTVTQNATDAPSCNAATGDAWFLALTDIPLGKKDLRCLGLLSSWDANRKHKVGTFCSGI